MSAPDRIDRYVVRLPAIASFSTMTQPAPSLDDPRYQAHRLALQARDEMPRRREVAMGFLGAIAFVVVFCVFAVAGLVVAP